MKRQMENYVYRKRYCAVNEIILLDNFFYHKQILADWNEVMHTSSLNSGLDIKIIWLGLFGALFLNCPSAENEKRLDKKLSEQLCAV